MSELVIRIPVMLEIRLDDSLISEIAERIREDDGREEDDVVENEEIKRFVVDEAYNDFDSFYQDFSPETHVDEAKATVKVE